MEDFDDIEESSGSDEGSQLSAPLRGGPGSSIFSWISGKIFGRLFRLAAKLVPITGALVGGIYCYTYFFGSIPIIESLKAELGIAVVRQQPQQSRVDQMLQGARDSISANDTKVHLGNAIATGDIATSHAIEIGELRITKALPKRPTVKAARESILSDAFDSLASAFNTVEETIKSVTSSDEPAVAASASTSASDPGIVISPYEDYEQTVTVVQDVGGSRSRFRNMDYKSGPAASAGFRSLIQSIRIGTVTSGFRPTVKISGRTFSAGSIIDFSLGVTFEGLAYNDTVLVFKEQSGPILPSICEPSASRSGPENQQPAPQRDLLSQIQRQVSGSVQSWTVRVTSSRSPTATSVRSSRRIRNPQ